MIQTPVISQRDPRWANKTLGFSTSTIGGYGCTLTCLTSLAKLSDVGQVNEMLKALGNYNATTNPNGAFLGSLIVWANVGKALKNLSYNGRFYMYDNIGVANYVYNKKTPVVVQVDATPIGAPRSDHYVLYLGDQKLMDPWTGSIRPTSDFPIQKGFALYDYAVPVLTCEQKLEISEKKHSDIKALRSNSQLQDGQKLQAIWGIEGV